MDTTPSFLGLVGKSLDFYGVDNTALCLGFPRRKGKPLQRMAFVVVEDESDSYRSMCELIRPTPIGGNIFFHTPIARVTIVPDDSIDGWALQDALGHVWLRFGTDHADDYYPFFVFDYQPVRL